ncbi:HAD-IA family hydrolase [Streptomyces hoynatensis]|uniref:HAD family hydrolase n=1 Tax=Streptomyces hoynatensis TaxID=1141874 RepID=A0A3A9ZIE8_9ACTN|nr:HAD-IA family hydrolase [Streptomyces hoynatensis]RKN47026.1 HAD family hydrolase [Streptomyces hoynatensis]
MSGQTPVRAVWTDFGGVVTMPLAGTTRAFCERVGVEERTLRAAIGRVTASYGVSDPMAPLDTPLVTEEAWARQVERVLAEEFSVRADLGDPGGIWFDDRPANAPWLSWLRALRAEGVFVGLLSNMVPTWDARWRAMLGPRDAFDAEVLSYRVGLRKPMPEIFRHAAAVAGVPAGSCVLVDDLPANCAGAREAGWRAVHFTDTEEAIARLAAWTGVTRAAPR